MLITTKAINTFYGNAVSMKMMCIGTMTMPLSRLFHIFHWQCIRECEPQCNWVLGSCKMHKELFQHVNKTQMTCIQAWGKCHQFGFLLFHLRTHQGAQKIDVYDKKYSIRLINGSIKLENMTKMISIYGCGQCHKNSVSNLALTGHILVKMT